MPESDEFPTTASWEVREDLLARREIALLDVREEGPHATGHPLFAANMPLGRIELDARTRLPRRNVKVVLFDDGEGLASRAVERLHGLGYSNVSLLEGNLQGWKDAGYEIFIDVNAPSKAFGELVEFTRHTPSFSAQDVQKMIDEKQDYVIVDARRYDEFQTMSIPTGVSVPGAELVLRIGSLAPRHETQVIVNCAGRTRSIIGAQSLINAGIPNRVAALLNGAIGWRLAQQQLAHGVTRTFRYTREAERLEAEGAAIGVAQKTGLSEATMDQVNAWLDDGARTNYFFDVRTPAEYVEGHHPSFRSAPGGQLVQETEMFAPVRGARVILSDTDGVRARMTGSWLKQMGWDVWTYSRIGRHHLTEIGSQQNALPALPEVPESARVDLNVLQSAKRFGLLDFSPAIVYQAGHLPGSFFASRDHLDEVLQSLAQFDSLVVTAADPHLAQLAWNDLRQSTGKQLLLLDRDLVPREKLTKESPLYACIVQDRYMRPYEGTAASEQAMQSYLDWEAKLVDQLNRDGTHHFLVI